MAKVRAFRAYRPTKALAAKVASKPYDVLNSAEARQEASGNPVSFLHINKPEIDLPEGTDQYSEAVYKKGKENLKKFIADSTLVQDDKPYMYVYRQVMGTQEQTGLVACSSIDDYFNDIIKKHELTREAKEQDRINHMAALSAHVGPVFLTYPEISEIDTIINEVASGTPEYDFTAEDDVRHVLWVINDEQKINTIQSLFENEVACTYIADGHHRAASSAKVGQRKRDENSNYTGDEEFNYFLSVLFPANQLKIIDYNRVITDLNNVSASMFFNQLKDNFDVEEIGTQQYKPAAPHEFGLYMDSTWYKLVAKDGTFDPNDPVDVLDVSILSKNVLDPILGIKDQRKDKRIDFVGGIRGLGELEKRVDSGEMKLAFAIYPVSIQQLIDIADSGKIMPPKSTWFEPKLRSGLLIHAF